MSERRRLRAERPAKARGQLSGALLIAALVAAGGTYLQGSLGTKAAGTTLAATAPSGAWMCPHGGGESDWQVTLTVANPGSEPVPIRVTDLGSKKPSAPATFSVPPGSSLRVPVNAEGRESSTIVEYFGGWVAAGWVSHAGGGETGVAAEPCLASAETSWLLPDGTGEEGDDDYVVVMNPLDTVAVVDVTLYTEGRAPIVTDEWSDLAIPPLRSVALRVNAKAVGEQTVGARVDASLGRVAAASLGIAKPSGGIRSAIGVAEGPGTIRYLPGADDQGHSDVAVTNIGQTKAALGGDVLFEGDSQLAAGLQETSVRPESAATFPIITEGPSTIVVRSEGGGSFAAARRTAGITSDQGATGGVAAPGRAWVVLPAVAGEPSEPRLALANPGSETAVVTLSYLPLEGGSSVAPVSVEVPPGRTVLAPQEFLDGAPLAAILAVADSGTFIPAAASYSLGKEGIATYAVSVGAEIPSRWNSEIG